MASRSGELLVREKEATRALDALAAERRRLPMVRIENDYEFEGPDGKVRFLDLFEGRRQLIVYHFMFGPGEEPCTGCSSFTDNIADLSHLEARDTAFALISRAPYAEVRAFKERMGWTAPWFSSFGSEFNYDFGVTTDGGEMFALSQQPYSAACRGFDIAAASGNPRSAAERTGLQTRIRLVFRPATMRCVRPSTGPGCVHLRPELRTGGIRC